uniref:Uncharacterized protein n=1 Tax=Cacopsylla melanoneura TaxID=428564 RepID=A0A8D8WJ98_9HEMI
MLKQSLTWRTSPIISCDTCAGFYHAFLRLNPCCTCKMTWLWVMIRRTVLGIFPHARGHVKWYFVVDYCFPYKLFQGVLMSFMILCNFICLFILFSMINNNTLNLILLYIE